MAIDRISYPANTPTAVADYQAQNTLISTGFLNNDSMVAFSGTSMITGFVFQVGGTVYKVNGTVSISGTTSDYVKITPSGATASAAFVANLTGVSWSTVYNGYYDGSGNRYFFDEAKAVYNGIISTPYTALGSARYLKLYNTNLGDESTVSNGGAAAGTSAASTGGGAAGYDCHTTTGGSVGQFSNSTTGGAIGYSATTITGGAVGNATSSTSGGAVGDGATSSGGGGAIGYIAETQNGGSIGDNSYSVSGFSGGASAVSFGNNFNICNKLIGGVFSSSNTEDDVYDWAAANFAASGSIMVGGTMAITNFTLDGTAFIVTPSGPAKTYRKNNTTTITAVNYMVLKA